MSGNNVLSLLGLALRGGRLAKLSEKDEEAISNLRPDEKPVAWAFRFLQSLPEVVVTLSGMSSLEQMKENIDIWGEEKPLTDPEMDALLHMAAGMMDGLLPCTACRYCTSHCPQGLEIPELLEAYNEFTFTGGGFIAPMALMAYPEEKKPSACIACRSCEAVCPQQIKISQGLADFCKSLAG